MPAASRRAGPSIKRMDPNTYAKEVYGLKVGDPVSPAMAAQIKKELEYYRKKKTEALVKRQFEPETRSAPERPVDVGYITNAPRVTMETNAAGNVITNTNSGPIVHQVEKFADGTFKIIPPSVQNFRGGSAEVVAPGATRYLTNEQTGATEQNYSSEYSDGSGGAATIGPYSAGAGATSQAVPPAATTVNTTTAPTVAPPAQQAAPQSGGFVVGKAYRDAGGNSRVYTGANPQNPRDPRNWQ